MSERHRKLQYMLLMRRCGQEMIARAITGFLEIG